MTDMPLAAAALPVEDEDMSEHVAGKRRWVLLWSLLINFFVLLALYNGVISVLLPNQIAAMDPASKAANLAIVMSITSIFTTLATPIAGALSDRTRSVWGRRSPWIALGSLIGSACLFGVSLVTTLWSITVLWVMAAIAYNAMQGPLSTVVADRFPAASRGVASGFIGAGMTAGGTVGIIVAGHLASTLVLGYLVFALAIAACCVAFVLINREVPSTHVRVAPFSLPAFLRSFWINPRKYPDFGWAFLGRFTIYLGYQGVVTYQLYILQDYINLSVDEANKVIGNISAITFVTLLFSGLCSGFLSDKVGRRKPFVFFSSVIMAIACTVPLFWPTVQGMYVYAAIVGLGYGAFTAVDMALMTQVLPQDTGSTGKDLGILTIAINIPQAISPVLSAWLLSMSGGNYSTLFIAAIIFVFASSFFVLPIRSVR
ncbi:MFS transporter [Niveispirillum irakense]|uniref:MFS transporter n=1 Tax=Niveispirillum irakense TaxID=34011 RepID=UPI00041C7F19|nr:MFS transporter [Niveispirillum irakense]